MHRVYPFNNGMFNYESLKRPTEPSYMKMIDDCSNFIYRDKIQQLICVVTTLPYIYLYDTVEISFVLKIIFFII